MQEKINDFISATLALLSWFTDTLFTAEPENKKKLCCCLAFIEQQVSFASIDKGSAVVSAANVLVQVMFIKKQSQQLNDAAASVLEKALSDLIEIDPPDIEDIVNDLNTFTASIPVS